MTPLARFVMILLVVIGVLAIVVGVVYFAEPARSLPGFFPGHVARVAGRHTRRGMAAIVIGLVLLLAALITERLGRRRSRI
jgi:hypothetical protein